MANIKYVMLLVWCGELLPQGRCPDRCWSLSEFHRDPEKLQYLQLAEETLSGNQPEATLWKVALTEPA